MIFRTNDQWKVEVPYSEVLDPPGTNWFRMVEIGLNVPVFLLEAVVPTDDGDGPSVWQRFLLSSFSDVQVFLATNELQEHAVSLLLPRYAEEEYEYSISTVTEVYREKNAPERPSRWLYVFADGRRYIDGLKGCDEKFVDPVLIYKKEKITAPKLVEE